MQTRVSQQFVVRLAALAIFALSILGPRAAVQAAPAQQAYTCTLNLAGPSRSWTSVVSTASVSCTGPVGRIEVNVKATSPSGTAYTNSGACMQNGGTVTSCSTTVTAALVNGTWSASAGGGYWNANGYNAFPTRSQSAFINQTNLALGATASASSTFFGYSAARINDGNTSTATDGAYSWTNAANVSLPQWVQLDFGSVKTFSSVALFTSASHPIQNYDIQYFNGSGWVSVVVWTKNTKDIVSHSFPAVSARYIRVLGRRGPEIQPQYVRVNELAVY